MTNVAVMVEMTGEGMMTGGTVIDMMTGGNGIDTMIGGTKEGGQDLHREEKGLEVMIEGGRFLNYCRIMES